MNSRKLHLHIICSCSMLDETLDIADVWEVGLLISSILCVFGWRENCFS